MPHVLMLLGGLTLGAMTMSKAISMDSQIPPSPKPPKSEDSPPVPVVAPTVRVSGRDLIGNQRRRLAERAAQEQRPTPQPAPAVEIPVSIDPHEAMSKWIVDAIIVTGSENDEIHESLLIGSYFDYCDHFGFAKLHFADVLQGLIDFSDMRGFKMAQDDKGVWLTHGRLRTS